jgi:hypothetical protein
MPELEQRFVRPGTVPIDERDRPAVTRDGVVRAEIAVTEVRARR